MCFDEFLSGGSAVAFVANRCFCRYNTRMVKSVIPWAKTDRESVRQEAEPYREMSVEGRLVALAAACRAAMRLLRTRDDQRRVLAHTDPLPESSIRALRRLQRQKREKSPDA